MAKQLTHTGAQLDAAIQKVRSDYADVSGTTALPSDVAEGKIFISANKVETEGTMHEVSLEVEADVNSSFLSDTESNYPVVIQPKATPSGAGHIAGTQVPGSEIRKYIKVESKTITENGTYNPAAGKLFSQVVVHVSGGGGGSGTINIYNNGSYDVSDYATAVVSVPIPTGTINITANGTHNVKDYEYALVNVSSGGGIPGGKNVKFKVNTTDYAAVSVQPGGSVEEPTVPTLSGYYFKGWYTGSGGTGTKISFPYIPDADVTLYALMETEAIVGFTGLSNQTPGLTLTDDIAGVGAYSTSVDAQFVNVSNPLDSYWPFSEIREMTDSSGNVLVKFPKMWMKWILNGTTVDGVKFANHQVDDSYFVSDAFADPSDTTGNTFLDYFALGKYEGSGSQSKVYSKSGQTCLVSITRANFRAGCRAYGTASNYYNGYQSMDIQQLIIYNLLCMMYYRTQNIQTVYGGRTGAISSWSSANATGSCDGCSGMNGWNTLTECVKMLGVENPYGNINKWIEGVVFSSQTIYIKRFPQYYDDTTSNATVMGFSRPSSSGFITALRHGTNDGTRSALYCSAASGGSATTYVGDQCYYSSSGVVLYAGGNWSSATNAGLWYLNGNNTATSTYAYTGGRLSYRPL